ncbi:MAG TPA: helical backbone metal receptor, partial [Methylomirabilota bacterium]|nr:helical backbone metal receptor [Methylomirabilota bacterium]
MAALCLALAACSSPPTGSVAPTDTPPAATDPPPAFPVTLTDDAGREVTLDAEPQRIVSLAPSNTEIVCALGACDRLVGVTDFDDYPPEVADIDKVVIFASVDVERVVAAEPDLVLAAGNELTPTSVIEQIDTLGLTVLVLYPETLEEVYADIELVGRALDRTDAAGEVVEAMEERVADVVEAVEGADRPLTLYEVFHSEGATYTA